LLVGLEATHQRWRDHRNVCGLGWPPARSPLPRCVFNGSYCEKHLDQPGCAGGNRDCAAHAVEHRRRQHCHRPGSGSMCRVRPHALWDANTLQRLCQACRHHVERPETMTQALPFRVRRGLHQDTLRLANDHFVYLLPPAHHGNPCGHEENPWGVPARLRDASPGCPRCRLAACRTLLPLTRATTDRKEVS
jgi:hypothetical protein